MSALASAVSSSGRRAKGTGLLPGAMDSFLVVMVAASRAVPTARPLRLAAPPLMTFEPYRTAAVLAAGRGAWEPTDQLTHLALPFVKSAACVLDHRREPLDLSGQRRLERLAI